jgi:hypothetical protein
MRAVLVCAFAGAVLLAGPAARAQLPAATGMRQVTVNTTPPGALTSTSAFGFPNRTPHTYQLPAGAATSITVGGPGFERLYVPIPAGSHDLLLEVQMSRPVFEAGLALLSIGVVGLVAFVTAGALWGGKSQDELDECLGGSAWTPEQCREWYQPGEDWQWAFLDFGIIGSALTIAGILMASLDRRRRPTYTWGTPTVAVY